jgi:predicted Zn-dependent protease
VTTRHFAGTRFDGRTATAQAVQVYVAGPELHVVGSGGVVDRTRIDPGRVSERFAAAPRIIALDGGASVEVDDPDGRFDHVLQAAGVHATPVQRMQRYWHAALVSLACLLVLAAFVYSRGLPAAAKWIAFRMPDTFEHKLGDEVLRQMDRHAFAPSRLPAARRAAIVQRFADAAAVGAPGIDYRIEFRGMREGKGINAMALPGGTIVLLDGLVDLVKDDDALVGVLGHELGHVAGKHSLRHLLQSIGIGALAAVSWGDFSAIAANIPVIFGVLHYSRALEQESDEYAIWILQANGLSTRPLLEFFDALEEKSKSYRGTASPPALLSTHPGTDERRRRLREADVER